VPQDTVVNVTGSLKRASWDDQVLVPFGGQLVSLQFQPPGGVYSTVRTMRSMSNGSTFGMVRVEATGCYRMVSAETGTTASATSPRSCVVVS
jgi:hypothetical protein